VGWQVASQVQAHLKADPAGYPEGIEVDALSVGGLGLMERLEGYQRAIIIDALVTGSHPRGKVLCYPLEALPNHASGHTASAHDTSLQNALEVGRTMGIRLPERIIVVGIEAQNVYDFSEELSPEVAAAVPLATETVLQLVKTN